MNRLVEIFDHFGEESQLEKLQEEVDEFIEAVKSGDLNHIEEEFADVLVILDQFKVKKHIKRNTVLNWYVLKVDRTINRIESKHYESKVKPDGQ